MYVTNIHIYIYVCLCPRWRNDSHSGFAVCIQIVSLNPVDTVEVRVGVRVIDILYINI